MMEARQVSRDATTHHHGIIKIDGEDTMDALTRNVSSMLAGYFRRSQDESVNLFLDRDIKAQVEIPNRDFPLRAVHTAR